MGTIGYSQNYHGHERDSGINGLLDNERGQLSAGIVEGANWAAEKLVEYIYVPWALWAFGKFRGALKTYCRKNLNSGLTRTLFTGYAEKYMREFLDKKYEDSKKELHLADEEWPFIRESIIWGGDIEKYAEHGKDSEGRSAKDFFLENRAQIEKDMQRVYVTISLNEDEIDAARDAIYGPNPVLAYVWRQIFTSFWTDLPDEIAGIKCSGWQRIREKMERAKIESAKSAKEELEKAESRTEKLKVELVSACNAYESKWADMNRTQERTVDLAEERMLKRKTVGARTATRDDVSRSRGVLCSLYQRKSLKYSKDDRESVDRLERDPVHMALSYITALKAISFYLKKVVSERKQDHELNEELANVQKSLKGAEECFVLVKDVNDASLAYDEIIGGTDSKDNRLKRYFDLLFTGEDEARMRQNLNEGASKLRHILEKLYNSLDNEERDRASRATDHMEWLAKFLEERMESFPECRLSIKEIVKRERDLQKVQQSYEEAVQERTMTLRSESEAIDAKICRLKARLEKNLARSGKASLTVMKRLARERKAIRKEIGSLIENRKELKSAVGLEGIFRKIAESRGYMVYGAHYKRTEKLNMKDESRGYHGGELERIHNNIKSLCLWTHTCSDTFVRVEKLLNYRETYEGINLTLSNIVGREVEEEKEELFVGLKKVASATISMCREQDESKKGELRDRILLMSRELNRKKGAMRQPARYAVTRELLAMLDSSQSNESV